MTEILTPDNEAEAAGIIARHFETGVPLALCGGNTRSGFGNPPTAETTLSSSALSGIVSYEPSEMVMTARAGTPLAEIEAALRANGQFLAFEPMDHRGIMNTEGTPTIGGVFAANVSGPRRFALAGAARDHLLGARFINGKGEAIKAGGRVMKNVTGLDLARLMAGSHGTLGFLTEVTFKVLPAPKAATTIVVSDLTDDDAIALMAAAMALPLEVSGTAHLPYSVRPAFLSGALEGDSATCLRLEGLPESVAVRAEKLKDYAGAIGPVAELEATKTATLWREIRDAAPYAEKSLRPLWRVSIAPSEAAKLVADIRLGAAVDALYDWQGGLIWMRMDGAPEPGRLRALIKSHGGGHATLMRADPTARALIPAFEPQPPAIAALSARIKQKLDPKGIFSPGKMAKEEMAA
ncbi:glycolate oxidase subunit GlcE [Martelella radicis]|uniref:Glycolate oxidase FAD binding subunit n=1 Tax=Martelella radicis TaxID=1397476 RepID=A0A7W6PB52_9HYPH|nr:glycolate oxidase subunit GlcE [Martelella radicis]MBB4124072.1 glycolate oxidase FAD binding subunit [Martelella radicis]